MTSKSEKTSAYILDKVGPLFNRKGYHGTSMTEIVRATGLTKGAVYGNFENKEDLLIAVFNRNVREMGFLVANRINKETSSVAKLRALTNFYRCEYYSKSAAIGGCPILNMGVNTKFNNPRLYTRVREVMGKLIKGLQWILREGQKQGELRSDFNADEVGKQIFAMIEGSIFLAFHSDSKAAIEQMTDHIDEWINRDMVV